MSKSIQDIYEEARVLNGSIKKLLHDACYEEFDDMSGVDFNHMDSEQLFLVDALREILNHLSEAAYEIDYLGAPIREKGCLHKNANGRYELNGSELTCGCGIEYLMEDEYHEVYDITTSDFISVPYWKSGRIEHNGKDYYIVGADLETLENVKVRRR